MKGKTSRTLFLTWVLQCFLSLSLSAQIIEFPLGGMSSHPKSKTTSRTNATGILLPFWDDFSYTDTLGYVDEKKWMYGKSAFLNSGVGILPPSKNVATLDGVDSLGKPYNLNNNLAKGLADKLVSVPIQLDQVATGDRSSVYLSFFYQVQGRGEAPDAGDQLLVSFLNASGKWETVSTLENNTSLAPDVFYQILIPVTGDQFYHPAFQFRIQNFARLSGPYDTWNIDYVYLNSGRSPADTSYPDRTISTPPTSLFTDYYAIPIRHFLQNPGGILVKPTVTLFNMRTGNLQPFDYSTEARITTHVGALTNTQKIPLDQTQDPGTLLQGLNFLNLTVGKLPPTSAFNPAADSIDVKFRFSMSTKDNVLPANNGDFDPAKYGNIDFRVNDTIRSRYNLSTYYAYDDGIAEYGAGLNQTGSYLAFKYLFKSATPDTLVYVDIYFPQFGDNSNQSIQLEVRSNLTDAASSILYRQTVQVQRNTRNKFSRYKIDPAVVIKGDFYVGWKQLSSASIPVGLDKNTNNANKMFYNTTGTWTQNTLVNGSMMIRPGFGRPLGSGPVTGLESSRIIPVYPNPNRGQFYLPAGAEQIQVIDLLGRPVGLETSANDQAIAVWLSSPTHGLVVVRYLFLGKAVSQKVMVLPE